jgi:small subunit ribosomal protein S11
MSEDAKKVAATEAAASPKTKTPKAKPKKGGKKVRAQISQGKAYIQASFNNTIVSFTDMNGSVLGWSSAGVVGFKGPKKATPYAASVIVRDVAEKTKDFGLKDLHVFVSGVGQGREGALRALNANNLNVLSIKDVTPMPHNGCRPPRPRRV